MKLSEGNQCEFYSEFKNTDIRESPKSIQSMAMLKQQQQQQQQQEKRKAWKDPLPAQDNLLAVENTDMSVRWKCGLDHLDKKHNWHENELGNVPEHQKDEQSGSSGALMLLNIAHT